VNADGSVEIVLDDKQVYKIQLIAVPVSGKTATITVQSLEACAEGQYASNLTTFLLSFLACIRSRVL